MLKRSAILVYGCVAYCGFLAAFLYMVGFVGNYFVPRSIDNGPIVGVGRAVAINVSVMLVFAIQHTIMARPAFKRWFTRYVPEAAERSTFVMMTSLIVALICWQWRPIAGVVWDMQGTAGGWMMTALSMAGWGLVLYSSFVIDHFELFGLRQVWRNFRQSDDEPTAFQLRSVYRYVRHPLMLGFLVAFWCTPVMTLSHLLFGVVITGYICVGVRFEERDLVRAHGAEYQQYRRTTPMIVPRLSQQPQRDHASTTDSEGAPTLLDEVNVFRSDDLDSSGTLLLNETGC